MVPGDEIERRLAAFQAALREAGLDAALVVQNTDLYYLAGTAQSAHLVVPADGEPALYVRRTLERARRESPLGVVEPLHSLRDLPGALAAAGVERGRLGLELDVLPAALYLQYERRLEDFELGDCSPLLRALRARKSSWEIGHIRRAAEMVGEVTEWVPRILREGMTEIELEAELVRLFRLAGHQGVVRFRGFNQEMVIGSILAGPSAAVPGASETPIVGPGPNVFIAKGASQRAIARGDPIVVDVVGPSEGYLADQPQTFALGPVADRFREP